MVRKLNPLQMIARELSQQTSLSEAEAEAALSGALRHLMNRAARAVDKDPESTKSLQRSQEYQAVSEALLFLGTQLIAFSDMEREDPVDDERNLKN